MKFGEFEFETPHARVLGDTDILTFRWAQTNLPRSDGKPLRSEGVSTSVWVKDSKRGWQNVHYHWHSRPGKED
jgi:ketosteroid isomerase-like protein